MNEEQPAVTLNLSDRDIERIVKAMKDADQVHPCRFAVIDPDEFRHAVEFYRNMNRQLASGRRVMFNTVLVIIVSGMCATFFYGILSRIKNGVFE